MRDFSKLTPEALRELYAALSEVSETPAQQWPPDIVEWVRRETGIELDKDEGTQEERSDFETALQLLLRKQSGYSLEDFEDGLPQSEYTQLAGVTARIERHRANKTGDQGQTWVKQLKVSGSKWENLCITVAPVGTLVVFLPTSQKIIETWDPGFLTRREGRLLQDFQLTATLKAEKNHISILRTALKKAAGISEDPFLCEGGLYTRLFYMGDQGGGTGGESEERFNDGYQIRTARRR